MEPIRLALKVPVRLTESTPEVKELVFGRRPIAADWKDLPGELGQNENMQMLSRVTNTELMLIEKLDGHDYLRANGVLQLFLGSGPGTGAESSGK